MAELVAHLSINESGPLAEVLEGYSTLAKTDRGKLYGEKDGQLEEIGRSAADVLFAFGESSGQLVTIEPVAEGANEELLQQQIQDLKNQLASERAEHVAEIERLNNEHEQELEQLRNEVNRLDTALGVALRELEANGLITSEARLGVEEPTVSDDEPKETVAAVVMAEKPLESAGDATGDEIKFEPGDKVRVASSSRDARGFDTVEEVIRDDDRVTAVRVKNSSTEEVRSFPPGFIVREQSAIEPSGVREVIEEEERRGWWPADRSVGALAVGAAGVLGVVLWETIGERIFGWHDGGVTKKEIINIIHNHDSLLRHHDAVLSHKVDSLSSQVAALVAGEKAEKAHEHAQDMGIQHLKREELKENHALTAYNFAFRYPWDWAANKFGVYRASSVLHNLAAQAHEHGHSVQWDGSGRYQKLKIDDTFNTRHVIGVLSQYWKQK